MISRVERRAAADSGAKASPVGLIPAAGIGSRLPDRTGSKEMIGVGPAGTPAIAHLLDAFATADIRDLYVVTRPQKRDIAAHLARVWPAERYQTVLTEGTSGVPETVALGLADCLDRDVAFGFPDILFAPDDAVARLVRTLRSGRADVVLGLFPTDTPQKMDMVDLDEGGRVVLIDIKPEATTLALTWILAVWRPSFSAHLLASVQSAVAAGKPLEHLGHALLSAMSAGLDVRGVPFPDGRSLDIGTPDDLVRARDWRV